MLTLRRCWIDRFTDAQTNIVYVTLVGSHLKPVCRGIYNVAVTERNYQRLPCEVVQHIADQAIIVESQRRRIV